MPIRPATLADRPVVERLLEFYLYDMAELYRFPIGADARYAYDRLDQFWQHPYLLTSGGDLAGLALVINPCPITARAPCWFMAEFFVMRPYRRTGLGRAAAGEILAAHSGPWHVGVIKRNAAALAFWTGILANQSPNVTQLEHDDEAWQLHAFVS